MRAFVLLLVFIAGLAPGVVSAQQEVKPSFRPWGIQIGSVLSQLRSAGDIERPADGYQYRFTALKPGWGIAVGGYHLARVSANERLVLRSSASVSYRARGMKGTRGNESGGNNLEIAYFESAQMHSVDLELVVLNPRLTLPGGRLFVEGGPYLLATLHGWPQTEVPVILAPGRSKKGEVGARLAVGCKLSERLGVRLEGDWGLTRRWEKRTDDQSGLKQHHAQAALEYALGCGK